ncbi:hypothetical protein GQ457_05G035380 [Hibiscus cannabinus]
MSVITSPINHLQKLFYAYRTYCLPRNHMEEREVREGFHGSGNATENRNSIANIEAQVSLPTTVREVYVVRRTGNPNRHGRSSSHPGTANGGVVPEQVMVNHANGVFGLPSFMKATAEVLGNGELGSSYKKTMMANGVVMVVKRTGEMNSLGKDEFDSGVQRLGKLKHPNVFDTSGLPLLDR